MKTINENESFSTEIEEKAKSVEITKNAKSAKGLKKVTVNDLIKSETKTANESYSVFRKYVSETLKDGNYNFGQVLNFLATKEGKNYISDLNKLNFASSAIQINQFNYNLFKSASLHLNYEGEFNFLQICRITEKNCINNDGETDFLYNEMFGEEITEEELIDKIHVPLYSKDILLNFKFEKNGIFAGYFVKPSFEKIDGVTKVKKDKDGKEIIFGIKMKYEQKPVLAILKEMHFELLAKKKIADITRINSEKAEAEKAKAEKAEAEAKAKEKAKAEKEKAKEAKAKAEAEAKAIKAKAEAEKELVLS